MFTTVYWSVCNCQCIELIFSQKTFCASLIFRGQLQCPSCFSLLQISLALTFLHATIIDNSRGRRPEQVLKKTVYLELYLKSKNMARANTNLEGVFLLGNTHVGHPH